MRRSQASYPAVLFGLLAFWIGVELLYSSKWISSASTASQWQPSPRNPDTLRDLLSRAPGQPIPRVWFSPYTTYPETGLVESVFRTGVYDTLLSFPSSGLKTNYGASKLSPADSLFAQASSQGIQAEARLARQRGYSLFALDLGAILEPAAGRSLCRQTPGCRQSSDGYVLFPLQSGRGGWIEALSAVQRRIPLLPQTTAPPRWNGLVFAPDQWWPPSPASLEAGDGTFRVRARPLGALSLYRYRPALLPPAVWPVLAPKDLAVKILLGPGLAGADVCLTTKAAETAGQPCHLLRLRAGTPPENIARWLPEGAVTEIQLLNLYDRQGQPTSPNRLPQPLDEPQQPFPVALDIGPPRPWRMDPAPDRRR